MVLDLDRNSVSVIRNQIESGRIITLVHHGVYVSIHVRSRGDGGQRSMARTGQAARNRQMISAPVKISPRGHTRPGLQRGFLDIRFQPPAHRGERGARVGRPTPRLRAHPCRVAPRTAVLNPPRPKRERMSFPDEVHPCLTSLNRPVAGQTPAPVSPVLFRRDEGKTRPARNPSRADQFRLTACRCRSRRCSPCEGRPMRTWARPCP